MSEVALVDYQESWPLQFEQVAAELRSVFAGASIRVEHIGSTSVPGLCSKAVLDVLLGALSLDEVESRSTALIELGYTYRPEYEDQLPGRRYFVRAANAVPRVHLHAVVLGGRLWELHLQFRDLLRQDKGLQSQYAELKRRLAAAHAADKAAYGLAKGPFIQQVLAQHCQTRSKESPRET